ncbi:hypothetical protein CKM354_000300000 [Cercospora kikuchii]|uniref:Chromosome transmission fidelity protein 8 n=1 Tax=Cercospora kikuchii TaxID=84275 RepID=A0A9P3CDZ1_9PEZI|nr:uncharacterized protein CKM354_000300000 [Cercospora kikuchii]GIZ39622.1 hypothetical protein CKM354_000300000 [Cercospora kikuchii]
MPSVPISPLVRERAPDSTLGNPLPSLLHTPSGMAMVELQGTIATEQPEIAEALTLGRLVFPPADEDENGPWDGKRVLLYVGDHQRLLGEVKKLAKPVAVVRRSTSSGTDDGEVEIAEVVYWKLLFSHRPEPLGGLQGQHDDDQAI